MCNETSFSRIYRGKAKGDGGENALHDIEKAYTQYAREVYRYLLSLSHNEDVAEELTQETFFGPCGP